MPISWVWEKLADCMKRSDVDKFKDTLTFLPAEDRLKVLCMGNSLTDQGDTVFSMQQKYGTTLVYTVAEEGHTEIMKCILDSVPAADLYKLLSIQNMYGNAVMHSAVEKGHTETVKCILDHVPEADLYKLLSLQNNSRNTPVHRVAERDYKEIVKGIVDSIPAAYLNKLLGIQNEYGYTTVHSAAKEGHTKTVKCIVDSVPADDLYKLLSIQNTYGNTAVHSAAGRGHTETVKCILDSVPTSDLFKLLSIQNGNGYTAVHSAAGRNHTETVKYFLGSTSIADLYKLFSLQNRYGDTAVHSAALTANSKTLQCIIDYVPTANLSNLLTLQNNDSQAAIHLIAHNDHSEIIKSIVETMSADEVSKLFVIKKSALYPMAIPRATLKGNVPRQFVKKRLLSESSDLTPLLKKQRHNSPRHEVLPPRPVILNPVTEELSPDAPYEPAPKSLMDAIANLLHSHDISDVTFGQSAIDWRKILVLGKDVLKIQPDLQMYLHSESLTKFEITLKNNNNPFSMKTLSWEKVLTINKKKVARNEKLWSDSVKQTVCQAFVIAELKIPNNNTPCKGVYAMAPAHLVLADKQNEEAAAADSFYMRQTTMQECGTQLNIENALAYSCQLADPPKNISRAESASSQTNQEQHEQNHDELFDVDSEDENLSSISRVRAEVESKSTRRQYYIKTENKKNSKITYLLHPVLLGYRHWYTRLTPAFTSGESQPQPECPEQKCGFQYISKCPHKFMNDLALFSINHMQASYLQKILDKKSQTFYKEIPANNMNGISKQDFPFSTELLPISTEEDLHQLTGKDVMVKGMLGKIVSRHYQRHGQNLGQQMTFELVSTVTAGAELKLIGGDCGSLVYVKVGAQFKPAGMFVGYIADSERIPGFDGPIYQAVVLNQAFKDIECDYPHQVANIELFSQERYSQLATEAHFDDS